MTHVKMDAVENSVGDVQVPAGDGAAGAGSGGVRPPRQERSRASLDRVLAAGAEVLAEGGYPAFTINEVARRAGASSGLIYTRFHDKAALFEAVLLRELTRMVDEENAALDALAAEHLPTRELIGGITRILADVARREAPLTKVFMERTTADPALFAHVKRLRTAPQRIAGLLVERSGDLRRDDPERAADIAFWIVTSALERRVHTDMWRHWRSAPDDWDTFVADLADVLQAFLLPGQDETLHGTVSPGGSTGPATS